MQATDLLEYKNKIIDAFKDGTFLSEHLKKTDNAAYGYVLVDVKDFIQEIESMSEKINLSLFEDFLQLPSPVDFVKKLINTENLDKNKELVAEIKDRISDLKDRIKEMSETEKINADDTLEIINKILDYNKNAQKNFHLVSKIDKGKSELKFQKSIAERVKSRRQRLDIINKKKENINNEFFNNYFRYLNQSIMLKILRDASDERNKDLVESINEKLTKMKNIVKNVPKYRFEEDKKIIDIVERILELNSENRLGLG